MNKNKSFLRDPALAQTDAPVARFLSRRPSVRLRRRVSSDVSRRARADES
jgi:hypothetical protein